MLTWKEKKIAKLPQATVASLEPRKSCRSDSGVKRAMKSSMVLADRLFSAESIDDIAAEFGIGKATAYEWRRKGLNELRRMLEET